MKVSLQAAQALQTPLAERGHATSNTCSNTTFTIRVWSLHTVIRSESAPVSVTTAVICFLSSKRLAKVSGDARPDGRQPAFAWSDLACMLNSYPPHYRVAFASSILPFPHAYRLALRLAFPPGEAYGVPMFRLSHNAWGRCALSTGSVGCP